MDTWLVIYLVGILLSWVPATIYVLYCTTESGRSYSFQNDLEKWSTFCSSMVGLCLAITWPFLWSALFTSWLSTRTIKWWVSRNED